MGGCQNYGLFLGTLNIRCHIILGTQKRDLSFDNHPFVVLGCMCFWGIKCLGYMGFIGFSV